MSKFDAAQTILLSYLALITKKEDPDGYAQCVSAIHVLEAAGKIRDKVGLRLLWAIFEKETKHQFPEVQDFIEALPGDEP